MFSGLLKRYSLTTTLLFLTTLVSLCVWYFFDGYQRSELDRMFHLQLEEKFQKEVTEQRISFDRYVKSFYPAARIYTAMPGGLNYIKSQKWKSKGDRQLVDHQWTPVWLPAVSMMRRVVIPRYALLLDESDKVREIYRQNNPPLPNQLLNPSADILENSFGQSLMLEIDGKLYILASAFIGENDAARLLLISPIDEEFLNDSQKNNDIKEVALLNEAGTSVLVSSNQKEIPIGSKITDIEGKYLVTIAEYLGTGSSALVKFASFVSTDNIRNQIISILSANRKITALTAIAYIFSFAIVMFWLTSRIKTLTNKMRDFSNSENLAHHSFKNKDELLQLENQFNVLVREIKEETDSLKRETMYDHLTNIPNRKLFSERVKRELGIGKRNNTNFLIIMADLNKFKEINDSYGHHVGDEILRQTSNRLINTLRDSDTVARLGGDEFCILLPNANLKLGKIVADNILSTMNSAISVDEMRLNVGISLGISEFPKHGNDVQTLIKHADSAMYYAKKNDIGFSVYDENKYVSPY